MLDLTSYINVLSMNITWYDKNNDIISSEMASNCQFIKKLCSFKTEATTEKINLIFSRRNYLDSFINYASGMSNNFDNLNIRVGLINQSENIDHIDSFIIDSNVIFIGDDKDENNYLSLFKNNACVISASCNDRFPTIAYQRHLSQVLSLDSISLSELRNDFSSAESKLRSSKSIFLKKDAVSKQDSYSNRSRITGINIYECCQLVRYAGLSTQVEFFFFNAQEKDGSKDIWDFISTSIWYYLEGFKDRSIDEKTANKKIYMVDCEFFESPIIFTKSETTNRWWFKHPVSELQIPCSENDYNTLRLGQIPDLMSAQLFGKLESTLKEK